jgi:hypothetical protein
MRKPGWITAVLATGLGVVLLIGCAEWPFPGSGGSYLGAKHERIRRTAGHSHPTAHVVRIVVPFFPDDTDQCGPATLASVLTYWGIPSEPSALKVEMYTPRLRGTLPIDLLLAARARGFRAEGISGTLDRLRTELDADRPVVALLNLGWAVFPQGHYVVITGYDELQQGVYIHSGLTRDQFVSYAQFVAKWEKTGRWMLQVQPIKPSVTADERADRMGQ